MFTQPVSMYCTKEWYERDLRQPLLDMGYKEVEVGIWQECPILINNYEGELGCITNVHTKNIRIYNRYFIDHYNPKLFLALAAMTSKKYGIKGEWWKYIGVSHDDFKNGSLYLSRKSLNNSQALIDEGGEANGFYPENLNYFKKATKEEIIKKFTIMKKDLRELLVEGRVVVDDEGIIGVVIGERIKAIIWDNNEKSFLFELDENLTTNNFSIYKVVEWDLNDVEKFLKESEFPEIEKLIWERKKQYTIDQLIEKAGLNKDEIEII